MPGTSVALSQTVLRALERQPGLRYETAAKLADELESLLDDGASPETVARDVALRAGALTKKDRGAKLRETPLSIVALRLGGVLAAMLIVFALVAYGSSDPEAARGSATAASAEIRLLAHPWAEVTIDGDRFDTTPIGKPALLRPGRHELVFRHPNAPEEKRVIDVGPGQQMVVEVEMEVVRPVDAGVDPSP